MHYFPTFHYTKEMEELSHSCKTKKQILDSTKAILWTPTKEKNKIKLKKNVLLSIYEV